MFTSFKFWELYRVSMMNWRQNFLKREQHLKQDTKSFINLFMPRSVCFWLAMSGLTNYGTPGNIFFCFSIFNWIICNNMSRDMKLLLELLKLKGLLLTLRRKTKKTRKKLKVCSDANLGLCIDGDTVLQTSTFLCRERSS